MFKHSAALNEVERTGLLKELQMVISLLDESFRRNEQDQGRSNGEIEVIFQWKNPDFLLKNPDLLSRILIFY